MNFMGKNEIPKSQRIGTCEAGEIAFNLDAFDRLYKANIIITKRLTDELIEKLIELVSSIINILIYRQFKIIEIYSLIRL